MPKDVSSDKISDASKASSSEPKKLLKFLRNLISGASTSESADHPPKSDIQKKKTGENFIKVQTPSHDINKNIAKLVQNPQIDEKADQPPKSETGESSKKAQMPSRDTKRNIVGLVQHREKGIKYKF
jgi:hypothetical protein